jgi:hypothetical protein
MVFICYKKWILFDLYLVKLKVLKYDIVLHSFRDGDSRS